MSDGPKVNFIPFFMDKEEDIEPVAKKTDHLLLTQCFPCSMTVRRSVPCHAKALHAGVDR